MNCAEYQENLKLAGMNDDERSLHKMDEIVKNNLGMRCPTCKVSIKRPLAIVKEMFSVYFGSINVEISLSRRL